ncbi:MAG: membrane associated rhomboid family serine protease [Cyclobacteriaceae bacterium]|jgi:membrane associated rhomboid family serine protease
MNSNSILDDFRNAWNRPNNAVIQIILINVIVFLALIFLKVILVLSGGEGIYRAILTRLMLPADIGTFIFQPWTIFTYFFTHEGLFHILFNMMVLYWFGKLITEFLGSNKVISLYVLGGISGGLFYMLVYNVLPIFQDQVNTSLMLGASAGVYAIVVGAATFMPNYTFFLLLIGPVKIKYIAFFYIVLSFASTVGANAGGNFAHLAGAAIGFVFIKQLQSGNDIGAWVIQLMNYFKSFFVRDSKIKVTHRSEKKSKNKRTVKVAQSSGPSADQDEIDAILDKISQSGYDSLSKEEKQKLFNASNK